MEREEFVAHLNEDLRTEFQSIIQYTQHTALITGAEYLPIAAEMQKHITQEVDHARILSEQIDFLDGTPTTEPTPVPDWKGTEAALEDDLSLERNQLERYRKHFAEANELGLADVAEALRPLLEQTQDHVRDLEDALGK